MPVVTDAGTIIDPDSAYVQTEGAALWGRSMAQFEGTGCAAGQVRGTNLDTCTPVHSGDVPLPDMRCIVNAGVPIGHGEPANTVMAPAIVNPNVAATGARVTLLAISPQPVLAALAPLQP